MLTFAIFIACSVFNVALLMRATSGVRRDVDPMSVLMLAAAGPIATAAWLVLEAHEAWRKQRGA